MFFLLARMPEQMRALSQDKIYSKMGRSNLGGMYLREVLRLGAMVVALPGLLGKNVSVKGGAIVMLQLSQFLNAAWRRDISNQPAAEPESAAVALQLASAVLALM